jgi:hypothetical protein
MNMIHGVVKVAFKEDGSEVIIPVVPQSIESDRVVRNPGICCAHSRHIFKLPGAILRLTLVARISGEGPLETTPIFSQHAPLVHAGSWWGAGIHHSSPLSAADARLSWQMRVLWRRERSIATSPAAALDGSSPTLAT